MVKICGLRSPDAVAAAVSAGADALGFVFAESPRRVSPEQAAELTAQVPAGIVRVAVMRHPSTDEWARVREVFAPDWLQTEAADFSNLQLETELGRLPVFRTGAELPAGHEPLVLFEGGRSGQGELADWKQAASLAAQQPLVLAGGLAPHNVTEAIRSVRPAGVDVSSGVESSPGHKSVQLIADFISSARRAEQTYGLSGS